MTVGIGTFLTVWTFLAMNIAAPGPNVLNTIATAMGSGRRAGLGAALGVGLGIALWCLGMTLGGASLLRALPGARTGLILAATGLLAALAWRHARAARDGWRGIGSRPAGATRTGARRAFLRSLSVSAVNPKAMTTWVVVLSLFPVARAGLPDIAALGAGAMILAVSIHAAYALAFSTAPAARAWTAAAPWISAAMAVVFAGFALGLGASLAGVIPPPAVAAPPP